MRSRATAARGVGRCSPARLERSRVRSWLAALAGLGLSLALSGPAAGETRRIAVVVGNNTGSGDLPPLHFAEADAGKVARVLLELGQISESDLFLLQGRGVAELQSAIALAQSRVTEAHRAPDGKTLLIFYYSGHSDGEALELGAERLPFAQLKSLLASSGAEVRVTIIDSCRSGAALLHKGGRPAPSFTLRLADDLSTTGEAVLASSAADEVALESRELQGSYFTSALISGLRGAADTSGDRQVTLAEAYRYAYDHTVSATSQTLEGAQHPVYDFRLSGQGELVLSSLDRPTASVVLPEHMDRALITDLQRDQVVAELLPGSARWLALTPGAYSVRAFRDGHAFGSRFVLAAGESRNLAWEEFAPQSAPRVAMKGAAPTTSVTATPPDSEPSEALAVTLGVGAPVASAIGPLGLVRVSLGPAIGPGFGVALMAATGSNALGSESSVRARVGYHYALVPIPRLQLSLGVEAGPGIIWQSTDSNVSGYTPDLSIAPTLALRFRVVGPVYLVGEAEAPVSILSISGSVGALFLPAGTLGVAVEL